MRFDELQMRARKIGVGLDVVPVVAGDEIFQVFRLTDDKGRYTLEIPDLLEVQTTLAGLELEATC